MSEETHPNHAGLAVPLVEDEQLGAWVGGVLSDQELHELAVDEPAIAMNGIHQSSGSVAAADEKEFDEASEDDDADNADDDEDSEAPLVKLSLFDDSNVEHVSEDLAPTKKKKKKKSADGDDVEDEESDEEDDEDDEDDDDDEDADENSSKKRKHKRSKTPVKRKKTDGAEARKATMAALREGDDDEGTGQTVIAASRKRKTASKISAAAKLGKQMQSELKKKRKAQYADSDAQKVFRAALLDYITIAACNVFQRSAVETRGVPRTFAEIVRGDEKPADDRMRSLKESLLRIEAEVGESFGIALQAMPEQMTVISDFVSGADLLRELPDSHTVDATQCEVLVKPFPRDQLTALETVRTYADGNVKSARLIVSKRLHVEKQGGRIRSLIEAVWFLKNMMAICERRVSQRLLEMPGFKDGFTLLTPSLDMLINDTTRKAVVHSLQRDLRDALEQLDVSTHKMTHGI